MTPGARAPRLIEGFIGRLIRQQHEAAQTRWASEAISTLASGRTFPTVELPDGEVGYCMDPYRTDVCLEAALATCTQIPIQEVPDLNLDLRVDMGESNAEINRTSWELIELWLGERGLSLRFHERVPVSLPRWIGVISDPGSGFSDHCLVMTHDRPIFDPSIGVKPPPGYEVKKWQPDEIDYGISFPKKEE